MERRKTMTMNWDGLNNDSNHFFETHNRLSTVVPNYLGDSSFNKEDFEYSWLSFASTYLAMHSLSPRRQRLLQMERNRSGGTKKPTLRYLKMTGPSARARATTPP
ncbi:hypothetical protein VNO78_03848 [Psophocarpus tetragonolobus]|uniref:Uncharacterized protein n=1 Tax=Psophocarpus tetragonolobus TaxID=3891 RepID=A0AAN9T130_PSOTE